MAKVKLNIGNPKTKNTVSKDLDDINVLVGKKIGDEVKGDSIGFDGYKFLITGGSDHSGFPMRKDVQGSSRRKVLITGGVGLRKNKKGNRRRRTVAGNTIYEKTAQVNLKVLKAGKKPLVEKEEEKEE